jgi:hypothetical protein
VLRENPLFTKETDTFLKDLEPLVQKHLAQEKSSPNSDLLQLLYKPVLPDDNEMPDYIAPLVTVTVTVITLITLH